MKRNLKKVVAAALAMSMCVPGYAFAEGGSFQTSFDVYSPTLRVSVPTSLEVEINPIADGTATDLGKYTVASNSIDIINASVDVENDKGIPVVATIKATIESTTEDVVTTYNTFTSDQSSKVKKIFLQLAEADTAAVIEASAPSAGGTAGAGNQVLDSDKLLDLSEDKWEVTTKADYSSLGEALSTITKYGSSIDIEIAAPTTSDNTPANAGKTFSTDATKLTVGKNSFGIAGVANANADWAADDVRLAVTYNIKPGSLPASATAPAISAAVTGSATSGATINVTGLKEVEVAAVALHNDSMTYKNYVIPTDMMTITYTNNAGNTAKDAKIVVSKDCSAWGVVKGKGAQDLVVKLTDGTVLVQTLTVN